MKFKVGYVLKNLCNNIKIICISYFIYNFTYKKLILRNLYIKIYDFRNEIIINDYVIIKYYKKSKDCNNRIVKIL
uniref:Small subunit ribosomal protein 17 n=1 Tax=Plasmodium fragile TaxID=5857 RepID=A0A4P2V338_PLAFR|nr:small subunit ribosomal protein 17 [Plasmodium fragile]